MVDTQEDVQTMVDFLYDLSKSDRHITSRDSLWLQLSSEMLERYRVQAFVVSNPTAKELAQQLLLLL